MRLTEGKHKSEDWGMVWGGRDEPLGTAPRDSGTELLPSDISGCLGGGM